jgi:hypothetical protein
VLDVDADRATAAVHCVRPGVGVRPAWSVDAHDVGTEIGEQHGSEWSWPEPGELDHHRAGEGSWHP